MQCRAYLPASLLAVALAAAFAPRAQAAILVNIDKTSQSMTVTVDGTPRYIWPVSTGKPGYDTPNGVFKANRMDADHLSQEWDNAPMPHTIFFDLRGHAIHGFLDTRRIGTAASHGCVRLSPDHAAALYSLVEAEGMKETTVVVSGTTPPRGVPADWARRHNNLQEAAIDQPQASDARPPPDGTPPPAGQPLNIFGTLFGQPQQPANQPPPANYAPPTGIFGAPPPPPAYEQQPPPPPSASGRQVYMQVMPDGRRVYYYAQPGYPPPPPSYYPGYPQQ